MKSMCPHCGRIVPIKDGLTQYHDEHPPFRAVCPGSKQNPRNHETDRRPLWNGEPNPHLDADGNLLHGEQPREGGAE